MARSKRSSLFTPSGFTLVEVLIAIMLLAFISLQTFRMVDNSTDTKDTVVREDQEILQSLTAVSRIDADFSQLYSPLYSYAKANAAVDPNAIYQDNATSMGSFDGKTKNGLIIPQFKAEDASTITFMTLANRRKMVDAKESRYSWVRYSLRRAPNDNTNEKESRNGADYELIRQSIGTNIYSSDLRWADTKEQVLMSNVKSLTFSFWDVKSKKYVTSLLDLNEFRNTLRALKMELVWVDENNHEQKVEKTYRILHPYFNPKVDDLKSGGAYGGGEIPPGISDPSQLDAGGSGSSAGGSGVNW